LDSLDDIIDLIGKNYVMPTNTSYLWEDNWKINFKKFIDKIIDYERK